jgi:hypothetical protein
MTTASRARRARRRARRSVSRATARRAVSSEHGNNRTRANIRCADAALGELLLERLDGLPLAIAQAGAYLQESGVSVETYLRFYDQQWNELMAV